MKSVFSGEVHSAPFAGAVLFSSLFLLTSFFTVSASFALDLPVPVSVSAGSQSLTFPWYLNPVNDRFNPVITAGTDRMLRTGERTELYNTANLGFFQNYWWMTGLFINTEIGGAYKLPGGFHADLRLGIGYLHYFWRRKSLTLEDGVYVEARDWGRPSVMVPLSIVLGYRGSHDSPLACAPFIMGQWAVHAPFTDETPAMTHFFILAGVRFSGGRGDGR